MEKTSKGRPWGTQDALQAQRGLLRSISPQHLVVEHKISYPLLEQRQSSCEQQQHCTRAQGLQQPQHRSDNKKACLIYQKVISHEGGSHQRQGIPVHSTHVVKRYRQHTYSQQGQQLELHQPAEEPRDRPVQSSLLPSRRTHERNTSDTPFRPQTADKQCSIASVTATPAGVEPVADQSTLPTGSKEPERTELRGCTSCFSIRQTQYWPLQQSTARQESPQEHMQQRNPQSHDVDQQLLTHEQEYLQDHRRQQQKSCQKQPAQHEAQYSWQQAKHSGRDTTFRRIVSDETENKSHLDVKLFRGKSVCHGPPKSHVRGEIGDQKRTDNVCIERFCSGVAIEVASALPLQTHGRPPAAAACSSSFDSHSGAGPDLSKSGIAPQGVSSATIYPAATATKHAAGAPRAIVPPSVPAATPIKKKPPSIRSHSLQEPNKEGHLREKFQRQNLSLVNTASPTLQQVGDAPGEATGSPMQVPIRSTAATQVPTDCMPPSQCRLLQESHTYAAFSKIAVELIRQQQQRHRSDVATHVYRTPLPGFPAQATVGAKGLLCIGVSPTKTAGVSRMATGSRTAHSSLTAHALHVYAPATTSPVPAAAPATSPSAGNRLQPATPWRRNVKSAAPGFLRKPQLSVHHLQHHQQEQFVDVLHEQHQLRQRPHTQQQSLQEVQPQELTSQGDLMQRERNKMSAGSPLDAPAQKEEEQVPSRRVLPVSASLQPHTPRCSTVTGTSSLHRFTSPCDRTKFPCHRTEQIHPAVAPLERTADFTFISPVDSHATAAAGPHVTPALAFASSPVETGAFAGQLAAHGSVPMDARSTSAVSATTAVARDYSTVACVAAADGTRTHSGGRNFAPGIACMFAGATAAVAAAVPAPAPTTVFSNSCAAHAAAEGLPMSSAAPLVTDTASTAMPNSVSARKPSFAVSFSHLTGGLQPGEKSLSGVELKTLLDISSYSLGSALHSTAAEAVAPGPLLLLFAFYCRIFSYRERENTCRGLTATHGECSPRRRSGRLSTVSSNNEDKANSITTSKSSGENCSGENCSKGEQVITGMSQSSTSSNNSSSSRGSGVGNRRPSCGSYYTGVNDAMSSIHNYNSSRICEDSGSRNSSGEDSRNRTCSRLARVQMENSTRRKLPPRIALSRLLQESVSLTDPSFGLLEAQEMVKHFSLYLPHFFIPPFLVEELWTLIVLTAGRRRAAAADNPTFANVSAAASSSDAAEAEFSPSLHSLAKVVSVHAVPAVIPSVSDAPRADSQSASKGAVSRRRWAGGNCSIQTAKSRLAATSTFSRAAATSEKKPRPATTGIHETAPPRHSSSDSPVISVGAYASSLLLNISSKQLHQKRLDFLGFTAFFAAVATFATKCALATALPSQQKATFSSASFLPTNAGPATSLTSGAAGQESSPNAAVAGRHTSFISTSGAVGVDADAAAAATYMSRAAFVAVEPSCSTAAGAECPPKDKGSQLFNFRCVQQFMRRFSTAKAVKRFLLEVYIELHGSAATASEQRQVNDRQKFKTSQSVVRVIHRIDRVRTEAVSKGASKRSAREVANSRRTEAALGPGPLKRSVHYSVVTETERKIGLEKVEGNLDAPRRRTEEICRRSISVENLAGLRRRWNSAAATQLKDGVYKDILNSINISRGSAAMNMLACPNPQKQTVHPERRGGIASSTPCSPAAQSLPSSPALIDPCQQQQKTRSSKQVEHPFRRHLWSVLPERGTLQWLLLRYTFSPVAPIWLPFPALFIDMGVQQSIPLQECQQEATHSAAGFIRPQAGTTFESTGVVPDNQCIQREGAFTDSEQHVTADKHLQAPGETCPKEQACYSPLKEMTDIVVSRDTHQSEVQEEQPQQQTPPQQGYFAQGVYIKTASDFDNDSPAPECGDAAAKVAAADGTVTVKAATAGGHGCFAAASALLVSTHPADSTIRGQTSSPDNPASIGAGGHSVPAAGSDLPCTVLKSTESAERVGGGVLSAAACFENCFVASGTLQAAPNGVGTVNTSASGSARNDSTVANRAVTPAPLQLNSDVEQQKLCSATEKTASEELAAVAVRAAEHCQLSLQQLPPNRWRLLRDRVMHQRHRTQQHTALLHERAIQKARRHRFAIEVENKATTPVAVVVDLENLPSVKASGVPECNTPLLLVPGSFKRIRLDVDRTHEPGEWLGFAHVRVRFRRSSSATRAGERGSSVCSACSGGSKVNWSCTPGKNSSSAWCNNSKGSDNRGTRCSSLSSEAQRKARTTQTQKKNGISNSSRERSRDSSSLNDKANDAWGSCFSENVVSIPVYLRLTANHEHEDTGSAPVSHPQATTEAELPVSMPKATGAAPAETSAAFAVTRLAGFVQTGSTPKQKRTWQRHARRLSPLPLHANGASIASMLGSISKKNYSLQPTSLCALCSLSVVQGTSPCQREKQQNPCQQHQRPCPQPKQQQEQMLRGAASEGATIPSTLEAAPHYTADLPSGMPQHPSRQMALPGVPATEYAYRTTNSGNADSKTNTKKSSCGKARICLTPNSKNTPYIGQSTHILQRSIERSSKRSAPGKNNYDDRETSRSSNLSSREDTEGVSRLTDAGNSSQSVIQEVSLSPSISVISSSPSNSLDEEEIDWRSPTNAASTSGSLNGLSAGQRLNAREYSFFHIAHMLERLQQMIPDCYQLGQRLLHQQRRLLRRHRSHYHPLNAQLQQKPTILFGEPYIDRQLPPCHRLHRQLPEGKWPKHQHIRWLRGNLLYGKDPMERKGWTTREAGTAAAQQHRRQVSPVLPKFVRGASATETKKTCPPPIGAAHVEHSFGEKLPWSAPLFYYDSRDSSAFRCSACGISFWGKFKCETKDDPFIALRNVIEEELREASTASCSTSVPLPWCL